MIRALQQRLTSGNLPALLITRNNMFLGEDVLECENHILQLTGFSGSAGLLLLTQNQCFLFVDGRYTLQAAQETDPSLVTVIEIKNSFETALIEQLRQLHISTLGYDPFCLSVRQVEFFQASGIILQDETALFSETFPMIGEKADVFDLPIQFAGKTSAEKIADVLQELPCKADALLICAADDVSWLANLRSKTLPDTPILRAFGLLHQNGSLDLFADNHTDSRIRPMKDLLLELSLAAQKKQTILIDASTTPQRIYESVSDKACVQFLSSDPIALCKSLKNPTELKGFQEAHLRDGLAVSKFLCWLDQHHKGLKESDIVRKLHEFRSSEKYFFSESFGTIAAAGAHAAIVHYQPSPQTDLPLEDDSVLLLDSGGQYFDGTTDVTRTVAIGNPCQEIKDSFTQVLKAHIALASYVFDTQTTGSRLDAVARRILQSYGKDFAHGTGHGVGHFSNVHEGPFRISPLCSKHPMPNMITSIEPGYYKAGQYGIRIENLYYVTEASQEGFLKFQNLTLIPIDKRLINVYLLSEEERVWLNNYHQNVRNCLAPLMSGHEQEWLKKACSPLP
jgi:Xaa-Pro aminopeptidase